MSSTDNRQLGIELLGDNVRCVPDPRSEPAPPAGVLVDALATYPQTWYCQEKLGVDLAPDRFTFDICGQDSGIDPLRAKFAFLMRIMKLTSQGKYEKLEYGKKLVDETTQVETITGDLVSINTRWWCGVIQIL